LDFRLYQIFLRSTGSGTGHVSTTEELLGRKSSGFGLESREYGRNDLSVSRSGTLYPQKLALTSSTSGSRSVGMVRSRIEATECSFRKSRGVTPAGSDENRPKFQINTVSLDVCILLRV
jgi:hypothetical protein